jgi:hypothetical protein
MNIMVVLSRQSWMLLAVLAANAGAFSPPTTVATRQRTTKVVSPVISHRRRILQGQTVLFRIRCENKYYQLEEMEDRENCTTELFLKEDGTVLLGDTDGPLWSDAVGEWMIKPGTNDFVMTITKKFGAGSDNSDVGEFHYELERTFQGDMIEVGESVAVTGVMLCEDPMTGKEQQVGFFNMIDGTDVRAERHPDARPGTRDETEFQAALRRSNSPNRVSGHDGMSGMVPPPPPPPPQPAGMGDPYGYGAPPPPQQQQQQPQTAMAAYEEQLRMQQQGYGGPSQHQQSDPYSSYYNQNQPPPPPPPPPQDPSYGGGYDQGYDQGYTYGQQQQSPPPPPQQQGPYGNRPSLGAYGEQNFGSQTPGVSHNFGGYGQPSYGIYADDDPGYGGRQPPPVDPADPYGYARMNNGGENPNPQFPPQQPTHLNPYGQDGCSQDGWGR